jgi:hypothetical protein
MYFAGFGLCQWVASVQFFCVSWPVPQAWLGAGCLAVHRPRLPGSGMLWCLPGPVYRNTLSCCLALCWGVVGSCCLHAHTSAPFFFEFVLLQHECAVLSSRHTWYTQS